MSLPDAWVERIFEKMNLTYGHQFAARWDGISGEKLKADWAHELRRLAQNPTAIAYGLDNLPAKPPSVLEFRAICCSPNAPAPEQTIALPRTVTKADEGSRTVERMKCVRDARPDIPECFVWAYALQLKDREDPGSVPHAARSMYREVIANHERRSGVSHELAVHDDGEPTPW